ncbi:MAG: sensor histidine kinase [Acidobacteriota bacterium]
MPINKDFISIKFSESQLRERNKALSVLLDMSSFLSTSLELDEMLRGAMAKVLECFELKAGRIYLVEDDHEHLSLAACLGVESAGFERLRITEGFSGKAFRTGSFLAQHVSELEDKHRAELLMSKGFRIVLCVPLIAMNRVLGVMNLATDTTIDLSDAEIDLLIAVGNQIAVAANNARLYRELKEKVKELETQKAAVEFFAYSISHDLKSPAVGVYGLTKRLQQQYCERLDEKGRLYCDQILRATEQIARLVDRINAYIMAKEAPMRFERVDLDDVAESIHTEFGEALERRKVKWSVSLNHAAMTADRVCLTRVLRNLVDNALKYGGADLAEIRLSYGEEPEFHIISVSDDGVGLDTANVERLFQLFQRHKTSGGTEGTGLGLAIVKEIAERHGGKVWVESEPGKGTSFFISVSKHLQ